MESQPHADPAPAAESPPRQQKGQPADAAQPLDALKGFIRLSPDERRQLLGIIHAECPEIWMEVSKEGP